MGPARGVAVRSVLGPPSRAFVRGTPRLGSGARATIVPAEAVSREVRGCAMLSVPGPPVPGPWRALL